MKSLFFLLSVCLLTAFAGCSSPASTSPYPSNVTPSPSNVTPSPSNTTPYPTDILVIVEPTADDPESKIVIDNITTVASTLDRDYFDLRAGAHKAGEPCFLLSCIIANGYNENYWVDYYARGYDSAGNQVSYTLEAGPTAGVDMVYIYGGSAEYITLHLNWADNVTNITLGGQMSSIMPP
jgi:hypothetical protein